MTIKYVPGEINRSSKPILFTIDAVNVIKTLHCIHVSVFLRTDMMCFHKIIVFTSHLYTGTTKAKKVNLIENDEYQ